MLMNIATLNASSAKALDTGNLHDWPGFFLDDCLYKVTTADNHEKGYGAGLIYADSKAMLETACWRCGKQISMNVSATAIFWACR